MSKLTLIAVSLTVNLLHTLGLIADDVTDRPVLFVDGADGEPIPLPDHIWNIGTQNEPMLNCYVEEGGELVLHAVEMIDDGFYFADTYEPVCVADDADDDADDDDAADAAPVIDAEDTTASASEFDDLAEKKGAPTPITKNKPGRKKAENVWDEPTPGNDVTQDIQDLIYKAGRSISIAREHQYEAERAALRAQSAVAALRKQQNQKLPNAPTLGDGLALWAGKAVEQGSDGVKRAVFTWRDADTGINYTYRASADDIKAHKEGRAKDATPATPEVLAVELFDALIMNPIKQNRDRIKSYVEQLEGYRLNEELPGGVVRNVLGKRGATPKVKKPKAKKTAEELTAASAEVTALLDELS